MAAFAQTTTLDQRIPFKVPGQPGYKMVTGSINITNYNATTTEITAITGLFKTGAPRVIVSGVSSNGSIITWVASTKTIKAYVPSTGAEVASDVAVGTVNFIAFGI